jgi:hypothetical protein
MRAFDVALGEDDDDEEKEEAGGACTLSTSNMHITHLQRKCKRSLF